MPSLIILTVVLLGAAFFTRFTFLFLASYLLIAILVLTHLWVWRMRRGLRVHREFAPRVFQGETVSVTVHIENRSLLPVPWLSVREALPTRIATYDALRQVVRLRPKGRGDQLHLAGDASRLSPAGTVAGSVWRRVWPCQPGPADRHR